MSRRERQAKGLGRTQIIVLRLLAGGAKSAQHLAYDWPSLTEASARSAVMRLADRGLVDLAGWDDRNAYTFCLTDRGAEVERGLNVDDLDEDDQ